MSLRPPALRRATLVAAFLLPLGAAQARQVAVRDLPKPVREIEDPFTMLGGAMEIRGGQVLMVDPVEMDLVLVDFAKGTRVIVGRKGSGPGEYRAPIAIFRVPGDSIWVFDAAQQRIAAFTPDLKPGATMPLMTFDQTTMTALTAPMIGDGKGRFYASGMTISMGRGGAGGRAGQMDIPDSVGVVRVDPRKPAERTELARVRFPTSGKPEMQQLGERAFKYTMAYPGLVAADSWTVFADGRVAIVRGAAYTVEFIAADGTRSAPVKVPYEPIRVTDADRKSEMDEAQKQMKEQTKAAQKMMPANMSMEFELLPPANWPATYPAVAPMRAFAAPDGRLWVQRAMPSRLGREHWDVIDASGKLVARWRLPGKTTLIGVGQGVVYSARTDEDDFRYAQKVGIPK